MDAALRKTIGEALAPIQATLKRIEDRLSAIEANIERAEKPSPTEPSRMTNLAPSVTTHTQQTEKERQITIALQQITGMQETGSIRYCPHW
jgi:hypothetical protein